MTPEREREIRDVQARMEARAPSMGLHAAAARMPLSMSRDLLAEVDAARLALRNVLALSRRIAKTDPESAAHLRRFCASAGVEPSVLRSDDDFSPALPVTSAPSRK